MFTWSRRGSRFGFGAGGDAHVVIHRELITMKHVRPGEAVGAHTTLTTSADPLAEAAARVDGVIETDRAEQ